MADDHDRTEAPTPHRRMEARDRGQVARSQDLSAAVLLLAGLLVLNVLGRGLMGRLSGLTRLCLGGAGVDPSPGAALQGLLGTAVREASLVVLPVLIVLLVVAAGILLLQVGVLLTGEPLKPDWNRLNPVTGLRRLLGGHILAQSGINLAKLIVVSAVIYFTVRSDLPRIVFASSLSFGEMVAVAMDAIFRLAIRLAAALVVVGIADWFYQRQRHERSLRMTRQEIKDELRRMEGDPLMKRRRREVQLKLAMQNLRRNVPQGDVVITNPTHIAVVLKYDPETMAAPRVLAKGEGISARRIRDLAGQAGVPIVERRPLAQALYRMTDIGQEVPAELYKAVAEVLAYVYQLSGRQPTAA
jgi:flagellar biosynthetic protein FlhB